MVNNDNILIYYTGGVYMKRYFSIFLVLSMFITLFLPNQYANAASIKLSKNNITILEGDTTSIKIIGTNSSVLWSSDNKYIASVNSKGVITGKGIGFTYIKAKVNSKYYRCKVTVNKKHSELYSEFEKYVGKDFTINTGEKVKVVETDGKTAYDIPVVILFDYTEIACVVEGIRTVDIPGNQRYIIVDFSVMNLSDHEISSSDVFLSLSDSNQFIYNPVEYNYDEDLSPIGSLNNFAKPGDIVRGEVCFKVRYNASSDFVLRYDIDRDIDGRASYKFDLSKYKNQFGEIASTISGK